MLSKVTRYLINGNEKMRKKAKLDKKLIEIHVFNYIRHIEMTTID